MDMDVDVEKVLWMTYRLGIWSLIYFLVFLLVVCDVTLLLAR